MEAFYGLAKRLAEALGEAELEYMFTGALAASYYGVPRTTSDIDVVVEVQDDDAREKLAGALRKAGLMVWGDEVGKAIASDYRIATFRDSKTAYRVDVILSDGKLEKKAGTVSGLATFYHAPEGLVVAKLRMIRATVAREGVHKDMEDIRAIIKFTGINMKKVEKQAVKDGTLGLLKEILAKGSG